MPIPASPEEGRKYLTAAQAAPLMGLSVRQVHRIIKRGELPAPHDRKNRLKIALDDVMAWRVAHPRPANPLEQLMDIVQRVNVLESKVQALEAFKVHNEEELAGLKEAIERGDLQESLNRVLDILSQMAEQHTEEVGETPQPKHQPYMITQESIRRSLSILERRKLPPGTVTVSSFAKAHQVKPRTAITQITRAQLAHTIYRRKTQKLKNEWWLTPEQQHALVAYWLTHFKPYQPCPQCPHIASTYEVAVT
jgi:excisionase family DNA binding protein